MKFKEGVIISGIKPETLRALADAEDVYEKIAGIEPTCSSILDSHKDKLHPLGYAADIRVHDVPRAKWELLRTEIDKRLNWITGFPRFHFYDVLLELKVGEEHIHIEYDPKVVVK